MLWILLIFVGGLLTVSFGVAWRIVKRTEKQIEHHQNTTAASMGDGEGLPLPPGSDEMGIRGIIMRGDGKVEIFWEDE